MPPTRLRRIARRAVMAMTVVVLLVTSYVGSVISASFAIHAGWVPPPLYRVMVALYKPVGWYMAADGPGSDSLRDAMNWAGDIGERLR